MIFITGDVHGPIDISKLNTRNFDSSELTKKDLVVVAGDFGLIWDSSKEEKFWLDWLNKKPWTTVFVDGNHENHSILDAMPIEMWNGGKVHVIKDSIIHLMRGQVFKLEDKTVFAFGGADSIDKGYRREHISWWRREMPSTAEYEEGLSNLAKHNYRVDYIITHTCPGRVVKGIHSYKNITSIEKYFDVIAEEVDFKKWFFGHHHIDKSFEMKYRALYHDIVKAG